ncbi:hypothetical protein RV02_GL001354 [Enterococcus gilvus]|nr:hypothetical protein RV02_GL001354 [Enterococcus gilvus]
MHINDVHFFSLMKKPPIIVAFSPFIFIHLKQGSFAAAMTVY